MNREQLIQAATKAIANGDDGDDHSYGHSDPAIDFLSAIAKLLLAQTMPVDAPASAGYTCARCHHILSECNCGPPPAPWVDWGEDEHTAPDGGPSL